MKKTLLLLFWFLPVLLRAQTVMITDPNAEKRTLSGSFAAIRVSDGIDLYLTQGNEELAAASASEPKYLANLKTEVKEGILHIYYDRSGVVWNDNNKRKLKVYVSFRQLKSLKASSGADITAQGSFKLDELELDLGSGAHFNGALELNRLKAEVSSGAEANVRGKAGKVEADASSGAIFKGYDLAAEIVDAKASSGGSVRVSVEKELKAHAHSGGGIRYKGTGVIRDIDTGSGGSVKRAEN